MANPDHVTKLKEGVEAWNAWRVRNPEIRPDLSDLDINDARFQSTPIVGVSGADLEGIDLRRAELTGARLRYAILRGARLDEAQLQRADFSFANLQSASLTEANLEEANFTFSYLLNAQLGGVNLRRANLENAYANGAFLRAANLAGAKLSNADFHGADLSSVEDLELDATRISNARFSPGATDRWSTLRRTYTGPAMVLNLIFVLFFFAPLFAKGLVLWSVSQIQQPLIHLFNQAQGTTVTLGCTDPGVMAVTGKVGGRQINFPCRSMPMWKLLLGFNSPYWPLMPALTAVLILYQVARAILTRQISLMRDTEERSGVSPPREGRFAYPQLYRAHQVLRVVFWISIAALAFRAWEFLFMTDVLLHG